MKKRIWELDALRGFAFILMVFDHLVFDLARVFRGIWFSEPSSHFLYKLTQWAHAYRIMPASSFIRFVFISGVFLFVSGISANLSKNNYKRGLKLLIISVSLTIITIIVSQIIGYSIAIYFGILHCLAVAMLLSPLFMKMNKWLLTLLGVLVVFLGIYFGTLDVMSNPFLKFFSKTYLLVPFNIITPGFVSSDFYPIFPFMGIYILGIVFGKLTYRQGKSIFKTDYNLIPLNYLGRNALWLYFAHQIILFVLLYLIGLIFL